MCKSTSPRVDKFTSGQVDELLVKSMSERVDKFTSGQVDELLE